MKNSWKKMTCLKANDLDAMEKEISGAIDWITKLKDICEDEQINIHQAEDYFDLLQIFGNEEIHLREDVVDDGNIRDDLISNADSFQGMFKGPKVI